VSEDLVNPVDWHPDSTSLPPSDSRLLHAQLSSEPALGEARALSQLPQHQSDLLSLAHNM
jgi:hypothetical protein